MQIRKSTNKGISLIEILVVISIFAVLGVLITRSVVLTVGGSKKSESLIKVRDSLSFAMSVIERQLRNADSIPPASCPNLSSTMLTYVDQDGNASFFQCSTVGGVGRVASGSATLTSSDINVTSCNFECTPGVGVPPTVKVTLEGKNVQASGNQNATVTLTSQINLRNY